MRGTSMGVIPGGNKQSEVTLALSLRLASDPNNTCLLNDIHDDDVVVICAATLVFALGVTTDTAYMYSRCILSRRIGFVLRCRVLVYSGQSSKREGGDSAVSVEQCYWASRTRDKCSLAWGIASVARVWNPHPGARELERP